MMLSQILSALHVAGHDLSLLMRQLIDAGTPKEVVARGYMGIFLILTRDGAFLVTLLVLLERSAGFHRHICVR